MNNHIVWDTLVKLTICWEVEQCTCTQYISYYTLLIMNDLTRMHQG